MLKKIPLFIVLLISSVSAFAADIPQRELVEEGAVLLVGASGYGEGMGPMARVTNGRGQCMYAGAVYGIANYLKAEINPEQNKTDSVSKEINEIFLNSTELSKLCNNNSLISSSALNDKLDEINDQARELLKLVKN